MMWDSISRERQLDIEELRDLLTFLKPSATPDELRKTVQFMRSYADVSTGTLTVRDFSDALADMHGRLVPKLPPAGERPALQQASTVTHELSRQKSGEEAAAAIFLQPKKEKMRVSSGLKGRVSVATRYLSALASPVEVARASAPGESEPSPLTAHPSPSPAADKLAELTKSSSPDADKPAELTKSSSPDADKPAELTKSSPLASVTRAELPAQLGRGETQRRRRRTTSRPSRQQVPLSLA